MSTIGPIEVGEIKTVRFDFTSEVPDAAVLSNPSVTVALVAGVDASPGDFLFGAPTVLGKEVLQVVRCLTAGATYRLSALVSDDSGDRHKISAKINAVN